MDEVLQLGFSKILTLYKRNDSVTFYALDGYNPTMNLKLGIQSAWVAFKDLSRSSGWEPRDGVADLGPFYIVWEGKDERAEAGYPWPAKVIAIEFSNFSQSYANTWPKSVTTDSDVFKGFELFRNRCMVCHALNRHGGDKGPDLLAPKAVVTYRTE